MLGTRMNTLDDGIKRLYVTEESPLHGASIRTYVVACPDS